MEWLGINLNNTRQQQWRKRSIYLMLGVVISVFTACLSGYFIYLISEQLQKDHQYQSQQLSSQKNRNTALSQQIEYIKNEDIENIKERYIPSKKVSSILYFIQSLSIQGGLELIEIQSDPIQIILTGKLSPESFEKIEKQIKDNALHYKIIQLQTNEQKQLTFNLRIEWEKNDVPVAQ